MKTWTAFLLLCIGCGAWPVGFYRAEVDADTEAKGSIHVSSDAEETCAPLREEPELYSKCIEDYTGLLDIEVSADEEIGQ